MTSKTRAEEAQARFQATFPEGHIPNIDVRTPADVAAQKEREGWK